MTTSYELFGVECGKGWEKLYQPLIDLCKTLNVEVHQVKEKFGGLRFYVGEAPEFLYRVINSIENYSYDICEDCGSMENVATKGDGWIRTLCGKCHILREKK